MKGIASLSLLLLVVVNVGQSAKTFPGTSNANSNLAPIALPAELAVQDVESIVRKTNIFRTYYAPSVQQQQPEQDPEQSQAATRQGVPEILLVRGSPVPADGSVKSSPFGFIGAAIFAYGYHQNLVVRPDDIWITILSQFSFYVNARSQALRDKFVNFPDGKKELRVRVVGYGVYDAPYDDMTRTFLDLISQNIINDQNDGNGESIRDWFLPGFTTTTETDDVVAAATAMCTFQDYFTYVYEIACGIPEVTLQGTVEDWKKLATKVERLVQYDDGTGVLIKWVDLLRHITANLVESAQNGSVNNLNFWDNIAYYNSNGYGGSVLSGWITVFSFFDKEGRETALSQVGEFSMQTSGVPNDHDDGDGHDARPRQVFPTIDVYSFNPNVLSCPAIVDDCGTIYNATLFAGQMSFAHQTTGGDDNGSTNRNNQKAIHPRNDWALVIESGQHVQQTKPDAYEMSAAEDVLHMARKGKSDICYWYDVPHFDLLRNVTKVDGPSSSSSSSGLDGPSDEATGSPTTVDKDSSWARAMTGCYWTKLLVSLSCTLSPLLILLQDF